MTPSLQVPFLPRYNQRSSAEALSGPLHMVSRQLLRHRPWNDFADHPQVSFALAQAEDAILLKFYVEEKVLRSTYLNVNDPVYNDSCVEFFIGFEDEAYYYNFEWNCAGTCLAGFGTGKERQLLAASDILKIKHHSLIRNEYPVQWELTLVIPAQVFVHHDISTFKGLKASGNFFKCGDGLPEPHYLSWNNILSPAPDFHLKEFFGKLSF